MSKRLWIAAGFAAAVTPSFLTFAAQAQGSAVVPSLTVRPADPAEKGDGTLSAAAKAAIKYGPLPFSEATVAAKAAANRARDEVEKAGARRPLNPAERAPAGEAGAGPLAPSSLLNVPGLTDNTGSPPDTTGAIGPTRFVQLVNSRAGSFDRVTGALIGSGTLDELANVSPSVSGFDPQVIWDATTKSFLLHDGFDLLGQRQQAVVRIQPDAGPEQCHHRLVPLHVGLRYTVSRFSEAWRQRFLHHHWGEPLL